MLEGYLGELPSVTFDRLDGSMVQTGEYTMGTVD